MKFTLDVPQTLTLYEIANILENISEEVRDGKLSSDTWKIEGDIQKQCMCEDCANSAEG